MMEKDTWRVGSLKLSDGSWVYRVIGSYDLKDVIIETVTEDEAYALCNVLNKYTHDLHVQV